MPSSKPTHQPVAIVQECRHLGCEFYGGIARAECVRPDHKTVGVDYVRASHLTEAMEALREVRDYLLAADHDGPVRYEHALDIIDSALTGRRGQ